MAESNKSKIKGEKIKHQQEMQEEKTKLKEVIILAKEELKATEVAYDKLENNTADEYSIMMMRKIVWNQNKKFKTSSKCPIFCKGRF